MSSNSISRRHALKVMGGGILGGAAMAAGVTSSLNNAAAQRPVGTPVLPQVGLADGTTGVVAPTNFFNQDGVLAVVGNILDAAGEVVTGFQSVVDLEQTTGSCDILNLVLGPLELDLLGLVVEIPEPVILNIRAEQGPGNLLGNLLCAVAGLLDNGGPVSGLAGLLNNILRALGLA